MPQPIPLNTDQLKQLAEQYGTPFHLYDETGIRGACQRLESAFGKNFPGFREFFAVKALPNPAILKIMQSEGFGLDASSDSELWIGEQLGFRGEEIMCTSNYTSKKTLARAYDQGVIMNLDDISLIDRLVEVRAMPEMICFRFNPGMGKTDTETFSNILGGPEAKYGIPDFQMVEAYRKAKDLGAKRFGIHMMAGTGVMSEDYFSEVLTILLDNMGRIKREVGIDFELFNIGGGISIPYRPDQKELNIERISDNLKKIYDQKTAEYHLGQPTLAMEMGRYLTGPYGWLISRCEVIKETYEKYYGLDACMANLMRPAMYGAYHHVTVPAREGGKREPGNVVGSLCENNDWFAKQRDIPRAEVGDLFVIHDTGAHGHAMGFNYNGKLRSAELLLRQDGSVDLIREHQKIEDLFENTFIPKNL